MKVNYSKSLHNKSRCLNTMEVFSDLQIIDTGIFLYFQKVLTQLKLHGRDFVLLYIYSPPCALNI